MSNPLGTQGNRTGLLANVDTSMLIHAGAVVLVVLVLYHVFFHK